MTSDLLKDYLGKKKRAGLCSFLPSEFIVTRDTHSVTLLEGDHGVPRKTVGVGTGQRSRGVLDSDQQANFM